MNQPTTLTEQPAPDSLSLPFEGMSLVDALELAIKALEVKAETYIFAAKMVAARGGDAVPEARKDAARRVRLLAAIDTLRAHKAGLRPY